MKTKIKWEKINGYFGPEYHCNLERTKFKIGGYLGYDLYRDQNFVGSFKTLKSAQKVVEMIVKG